MTTNHAVISLSGPQNAVDGQLCVRGAVAYVSDLKHRPNLPRNWKVPRRQRLRRRGFCLVGTVVDAELLLSNLETRAAPHRTARRICDLAGSQKVGQLQVRRILYPSWGSPGGSPRGSPGGSPIAVRTGGPPRVSPQRTPPAPPGGRTGGSHGGVPPGLPPRDLPWGFCNLEGSHNWKFPQLEGSRNWKVPMGVFPGFHPG